MLTLYNNGEQIVLQQTEYYVRELVSGLDEVIFDISIWDPNYPLINEEANIVDRADQRYLVKQIDGGPDSAKVVCQIDLDEWKASMLVSYDSGSKTVAQQVEAVKPTGWTVQDLSGSTISRTLHGDYTPLEVCQECCNVYKVYMRWYNRSKTIQIYPQAMGDPVGAFATRELNLKEINYKGKSQNFATRLYAYGKDGLSLEGQTIHGETYAYPYVDNNSYSSRVICAYWQDERYTDPESLYDDAVEKLALLAVPERSYDCSIVDLKATNPSIYGNFNFDLLSVATLIDDAKETAVNYQVVERHVWPYHPDRNEVIFDSAPQKITSSVVQIVDAIENPNSEFQQIQSERIKAATDWLLSGEGYVVARQGSDGQWSELLFMDTNDEATATNVLRINRNGLGFSTNGVNGPYTNAWTIDGNLVADFITTGTLTANLIKAGTLTDYAGKFSLNMTTGALTMNDGNFNGTVNVGGGAGRNGAMNVYDGTSSARLLYTLNSSGLTGYSQGSQGVGQWKNVYALNENISGTSYARFALGGIASYDASDMSEYKLYFGLTQNRSSESGEYAMLDTKYDLSILSDENINILAGSNYEIFINAAQITLNSTYLNLGDVTDITIGSDYGYTGTINGAEFVNGICIGPA